MNSNLIKNTYFDYLSDDLILYIWSFNYKWASNIIRKYTKRYIREKIYNIHQLINFAHFQCDLGWGLKNYKIFYREKILDKRMVLTTMISCKCCPYHQIDKPNGLYFWKETKYNWVKKHNNKCTCPCRHLAREICRKKNLDYSYV